MNTSVWAICVAQLYTGTNCWILNTVNCWTAAKEHLHHSCTIAYKQKWKKKIKEENWTSKEHERLKYSQFSSKWIPWIFVFSTTNIAPKYLCYRFLRSTMRNISTPMLKGKLNSFCSQCYLFTGLLLHSMKYKNQFSEWTILWRRQCNLIDSFV